MSEELEKKLKLARSRSDRLKMARDEAENLLEQKSRELYVANQKLEAAQKGLEDEIKQATYELSVSNKRLQQTLNERSRFIGQMSHEVRTPLNAITGLSEILLTTEMAETQRDYVDTINSAARSLIVLLNDMLDITKIEAGKLALHLGSVDTARIHRNIVSMFRMEAEEKGLNLVLEIDPSVLPFLRVDKGRYKQILNNLISNAIKNTDKGSVKINVCYDQDAISSGIGSLTVQVIDTGVGIPEHQIDNIFNAYEQLGNPQSGAGLGLAICSQLVELMQGEISCDSTVGEGSVFEISIPAEIDVGGTMSLQNSATHNNVDGSKLRILVAEDNPTNQKVLTAQLAQLGQIAEIVNNGAEALDSLRGNDYDLVLLDIIMPVMDGEETIKIIRSMEERIANHYCVALTASNYQNQRERMLDLGFDSFLGKPLSLSELAEALAKVPNAAGVSEMTATDNGSDVEGFDSTYFETQFGDVWEIVFVDIAKTYLEHTADNLKGLEEAIADGNSEEVSKISHSLKGGSASMGLVDLANSFEQMEKESSAIELQDWYDHVERMWEKIEATIKNEIVRIDGGANDDS